MPRGFLVRGHGVESPIPLYDDYNCLPLDLSLKPSSRSYHASISLDSNSSISNEIVTSELLSPEPTIRQGDIDPAFNEVQVTDEAKAELAKIENKLGDYICRLCGEWYEDPFGLARHHCSGIIHVEYRCSICDKIFNCPANLASHKRWHKPKQEKQCDNEIKDYHWKCIICNKTFKKQTYLRKHLITHRQSINHIGLPFITSIK